jgi:hypothetical protein
VYNTHIATKNNSKHPVLVQNGNKKNLFYNVVVYFSCMMIRQLFFVIGLLYSYAFAQILVEPPYGHSYGIRKATPAKLFMFFGPITKFDDPEGIASVKMKSRDNPNTIDDDDEVVVYGVNSGRHQLIYNTSMWTLGIYGSKGSGQDQFLFPQGIAIDPDGNVYVADYGNNRIVHLCNPKKEVHWVNSFNGKNPGDPGLNGPKQVALDDKGRIVVSDSGNSRLVVFEASGKVAQTIPLNRSLPMFEQGPVCLSVADGADEWSFFRSEHVIFCADKKGRRLWKIGFNGVVDKTVILPGDFCAGYAATDYYHNVWITDKIHNCILKFDHNLDFLEFYGSFGEGKDQFVEPRGITIWKRYGQVFIAEKTGAQYFWVGSECKASHLKQNNGSSYTLSLTLPEYSYASLFTVGKDTSWVFNRWMAFAGKAVLPFEDRKKIIIQGKQLFLRIEPTYSSFTYTKTDYPITIDK